MEARSQAPHIEMFIDKLRGWGLESKIKRCALYDFDQSRWQANRLSVRFLEFNYRCQRKKPGEERYFAGYTGHRQTETIARLAYLKKVRRKLMQEVSGNIWVQQTGDFLGWLNSSRLLAIFLGALIVWVIPLLFLRLLLQHCNWKRGIKTENYSGVAVDHIFGITQQSAGEIDRVNYHDGFLVEDDVSSPFYGVALLGYGWSLNEQKLKVENQSAKRFRVFGWRGRRVLIAPSVALKLLLRHWVVACNLLFVSSIKVSCLKNYYVLAYCRDRFLASLSFTELRPTTYLSRMDYSHRHHAVGAACKDTDIHYAGICHSALGGDGYIPQRSIISFDTFFVYSSWFPAHFFPTWSNSFTSLQTMGVWRSDLSIQARQIDSINQKAQVIRQGLQKNWIVALHLPVPQAYMFDLNTTNQWMEGFANLVESYSDVSFILLPRRLAQAPDLFQTQVKQLTNFENCILAEELEPNWQQSYCWSIVCDMVIGCFYSDAVAEALAARMPAILYTDTGMYASKVEQFDRSLVAYRVEEIANAINSAREGIWPDKLLWQRIHEQFLGAADGQCMMRIRSVLAKTLASV